MRASFGPDDLRLLNDIEEIEVEIDTVQEQQDRRTGVAPLVKTDFASG